MTVDDVIKKCGDEIAGSEGRSRKIKETAQEVHAKAIAEADRVHKRAVHAANTALEETQAKTYDAHARGTARALEKFDAAVKEVLGCDDLLWIKTCSSARLELRSAASHTPVGEASNLGPAGWHLDGPNGRAFLGPGGELTARAGLWRIAADLARTSGAPVRR